MKRAQRIVAKAALFTLLGMMATTIVAWLCIARADLRPGPVWWTEPVRSWPRAVPERWPPGADFGARFGPGWRTLTYMRGFWSDEEDDLVHHSIFIYRAGWPLPALGWESWGEMLGDWKLRDIRVITDGHPHWLWHLGLAYPSDRPTDIGKRLPIRPVWPGFAINTMLYAALAAGLWYATGALQRMRRRQGGRCLKCGYSRAGLAEDAVCPECGGGGAEVAKP